MKKHNRKHYENIWENIKKRTRKHYENMNENIKKTHPETLRKHEETQPETRRNIRGNIRKRNRKHYETFGKTSIGNAPGNITKTLRKTLFF